MTEATREDARSAPVLRTGLLLAGMLLLAVVPVDVAMSNAGASAWRWMHVVATGAGLLALLAVSVLLGVAGRMLLVVILPACLAVRALYVGLLHFSGQGFTDEVFLHLEREAVAVAWMEYRSWVLVLVAGLLVAGGLAAAVAVRLRASGARRAALAMVAAVPLLALSARALPEVQLGAALARWYVPPALEFPDDRLQLWHASGLVELELPPKHRITAVAPANPRNLVLLFIESGGVALAEHPDYPGLMPNMRRLLARHSLVETLHASAYITIEGLVNSMCGTLFPFHADSEELAASERLAEWMPCLGDVLAAAGYEQSYMGGASLAFAGKGAFLAAHGYRHRKGIDEWRAMGTTERAGTWGLSDADLLSESHAEIERLRMADRPFNLTLLTIGMHVPGYAYDECAPYGDGSERFLNAVACTDQLLGRWLQRLEEDGVMKDTLVVITADHHVFPNPEMKRLFGAQAVLDRRLPLVVLGPAPSHGAEEGASYDLAPTILDLLGIEHNARFALGRSLLGPAAERAGFFRKYEDIVRGKAAENLPCSVPADGVPAIPLSGCEKQELLELLSMQHAQLSLGPSVLQCDGAVGANRLLVPLAEDEPFSLVVAAREQAHRFTRNSRAVDPSAAGLYVALVDARGQVLERRYLPPEQAQGAPFPSAAGAAGALVLWRGSEELRANRPSWLPDAERSVHAWLFSAPAGDVISEAGTDEAGNTTLVLGRAECNSLLSSRAGASGS